MYRFSSRSLNGAQVLKGFRSSVSLVLFLSLFCVRNVQAEEIQFQPAQLLYAGAVPLDPGTYSIPCVTDWNGDGKKDLLVGYNSDGKIALYLNTNTDANPMFSTTPEYLKVANNKDITLYSGSNCGAPAPFVCDYNSDGKRDLLVGIGSNGQVNVYCNTNTDVAPILASAVAIQVDGKALSVGIRATPYVYDWNNDGKNDLICGTGGGTNLVFLNTNTPQAPEYSTGFTIKTNGVVLALGTGSTLRSVVRMFDWDGDGLQDLMGSSDTGVYWCKNTGTPSSPAFQSLLALKAPTNNVVGLIPITTMGTPTNNRMRLDLADWNNDGVMDLLVGDTSGKVSYFRGYRFMTSIIGQDMCGGYILQWNSASYLKYNVWAGHTLVGMTNCVGTNLPSGGITTCWTNACGDTQQFYRLQIAE